MAMRYHLQCPMRPGDTLIGTYHFLRTTVQLHQAARGQLRWSCNCATFQQEHTLREELWCEHITRAAALRSIERLMRWRA